MISMITFPIMTKSRPDPHAQALLTSAPCHSLFSSHNLALAMRKKLYRLGAKALGLTICVQGCELTILQTKPLQTQKD